MSSNGPIGIWKFPQLDELEQFLVNTGEAAKQSFVDNEEENADYISDLEVKRLIVHGRWGRGTATVGKDGINIFVVIEDTTSPEPEHLTPRFDLSARSLTQRMITVIQDPDVNPPSEAPEWFPTIDLQPVGLSNMPSQIMRTLTTDARHKEGEELGEGERMVFDLTEAVAIVHKEDVNFENLPRIPLEELLEEETEEEEEVVEETVEEVEEEEIVEEEEDEDEEDDLRDKFPDIPPHLRGGASEDGTVEVPIGNKDTKTVDPRAPYGFEIIMATGVPNPEFLDDVDVGYSADPAIQADVMGGIGGAKRAGRLDPSHPNSTSSATYPRTGEYIRNYLKFNGPSYALEMFKEMAIYCQFVNSIYGYNLRIGTYQSFRNFIQVLKRIPEEGGPGLIRKVTRDEIEEYDLDVVADHPKIEGEKAPWLKDRQYYVIIEENENHEAWGNPYDFLHRG